MDILPEYYQGESQNRSLFKRFKYYKKQSLSILVVLILLGSTMYFARSALTTQQVNRSQAAAPRKETPQLNEKVAALATQGKKLKVMVKYEKPAAIKNGNLSATDYIANKQAYLAFIDSLTSQLTVGSFTVVSKYSDVPYVMLEINGDALLKLRSITQIEGISEVNYGNVKAVPQLKESKSQINAVFPDINNLPSQPFTGRGGYIAVIDSGTNPVPGRLEYGNGLSLLNACLGGANCNPDPNPVDIRFDGGDVKGKMGIFVAECKEDGCRNADAGNHGSIVADTAAGRDYNGYEGGVAEGASIVSVKVDDNLYTLIDALEWVSRLNAGEYGAEYAGKISAINISQAIFSLPETDQTYGRELFSETSDCTSFNITTKPLGLSVSVDLFGPHAAKIQALSDMGVAVVVSSGGYGQDANGPYANQLPPYACISPYVFISGAAYENKLIGSDTMRGPKFINYYLTPGQKITVVSLNNNNQASPREFATDIPTQSFATPHLAGVIANLKEMISNFALKKLDGGLIGNIDLQRILYQTGTPVVDEGYVAQDANGVDVFSREEAYVTGAPKVTGVVQYPAINNNPPPQVSGDFTAFYEGFLEVPAVDEYVFSLRSDDGVKLWFNNELLLDQWVDRQATLNEVQTSALEPLQPGVRYPIKIAYYNANGGIGANAILEFSARKQDSTYSLNNANRTTSEIRLYSSLNLAQADGALTAKFYDKRANIYPFVNEQKVLDVLLRDYGSLQGITYYQGQGGGLVTGWSHLTAQATLGLSTQNSNVLQASTYGNMMLVTAAYNTIGTSTAQLNSVTYCGVPMTRVGTRVKQGDQTSEMWYLVNPPNPPSGQPSCWVEATFSSDPGNRLLSSTMFNNVDTVAPVESSNTGGSTSSTSLQMSSAGSKDTIYLCTYSNNMNESANIVTPQVNSSWRQLWSSDYFVRVQSGLASSIQRTVAGQVMTQRWTSTQSHPWASICANFRVKPFAVSVPPILPPAPPPAPPPPGSSATPTPNPVITPPPATVLPSPTPTPTPSSTAFIGGRVSNGWRVDFYPNTTFSGSGNLGTVGVSSINLDWGSGSPSTFLPVDNFSARFVGTLKAPATGTYTFRLEADYSAKVLISGAQIISGGGVREASFNMTSGQNYNMQVDYIETTGLAKVKLFWKTPGSTTFVAIPSNVMGAPPRTQFTGLPLDGSGGGTFVTEINYPQNSCQHTVRFVNKPNNSTQNTLDEDAVIEDTLAFEETSSRLIQDSGATWTNICIAQASGACLNYTKNTNLGFTFTTSAKKITYLGRQGTTFGSMQVYVDGVVRTTINNYSSATTGTQIRRDIDLSTYACPTPTPVPATPTPSPTPFPTASPSANTGWGVMYFPNTAFTGGITGAKTQTVNFDWGAGGPGSPIAGIVDNFAARIAGKLKAPATGSYTFQTMADNYVGMLFSGVKYISAGGTQTFTIPLTQGQSYNLKLDYIENTGNASMKLYWKTPGSSTFVLVPASVMTPVSFANNQPVY